MHVCVCTREWRGESTAANTEQSVATILTMDIARKEKKKETRRMEQDK
jgi:hypothetical protein